MSITLLSPKESINFIETVKSHAIMPSFSKSLIDFIQAFSKELLENKENKSHPDLIALGFWMRKANLVNLKNQYLNTKQNKIWIARGLVFHIAPSNVDTIFIYSLFLSLLIGNTNIVRVSQSISPAMAIIIKTLNSLLKLPNFSIIKPMFCIVTYPHLDEINDSLSLACDTRVIWGGDSTVKKIRKSPLKPTATEITFADKYSLSIIQVETYLKNENKIKIAELFFNDSFWFDQLACSSPKSLFWLSSSKKNIVEAQSIFWKELDTIIKKKRYEFPKGSQIDKLTACYDLAISGNNDMSITQQVPITRVEIKTLGNFSREFHCGKGLFYEHSISNLSELTPHLTRKDQTVSTYGISKKELTEYISSELPRGIDRIVPIGKALDFDIVWDGQNIFQSFSREITIDI